jgi:hypothetical protein
VCLVSDGTARGWCGPGAAEDGAGCVCVFDARERARDCD